MNETLTTLEKENTILKTRIDNLQSNTVKLKGRLDDISELVAYRVEFGDYTEEEKEAVRRRFNLREFTEEEKQLYQDFNEIAMELQGKKRLHGRER